MDLSVRLFIALSYALRLLPQGRSGFKLPSLKSHALKSLVSSRKGGVDLSLLSMRRS